MDTFQALPAGGAPADAVEMPRITLVARDPAVRGTITRALAGIGLRLERVVESVRLLDSAAEPEAILLAPIAIKHEGIGAARAAFPDTMLIAVVEKVARHRVRSALVEGADGVVLLDDLEQTLVATLAAARVGVLAVPKLVRNALARPVLSTREKQILGMVVLGFTNAEIAKKLVLSESTIKSHLSSAFHKLGVRSRTEAAAVILDSDSGLGTGILAISGAR
jgi:DNA-binding NarL/FixJ family response regulator